jgi:hypothetical protein
LILGLVGFLFFSALAVLSNVYANETTTWWTTALFVGFALLALAMIGDYVLARHDVSERGLSYGRLTGPRGYLEWGDLRRVRYSQAMKWFVLETRSGKTARISAMLVGLPEFARLLLTRAPAGVIESETAAILHDTAGGNPPPIWS